MRYTFSLSLLFSLLLFSFHSHAKNQEYYQALKHIDQKEFDEAVYTLESWLENEPPNPLDKFKGRILLALTKLHEDPQDIDAPSILEEALCQALTEEQQDDIEIYCDSSESLGDLGKLEQEMLAAGLFAFGTGNWYGQQYLSAVRSYDIGSLVLAETLDNQSKSKRSLETDDKSLNNQIGIEKTKENIQQDVLRQVLGGTGDPQINPQQMQELAMQLQQQAMGDLARGTKAKTDKKLVNAVSNERRIFASLANKSMCQSENTFEFTPQAGDQAENIRAAHAQGLEFTRKELAKGVELIRGQRTQDLSIAQEDVMQAVSQYLHNLEKIKQSQGVDFLFDSIDTANSRSPLILEVAGRCHQSIKIGSTIRNALLTSLNRRDRSKEYIVPALALLDQLYRSNTRDLNANAAGALAHFRGVLSAFKSLEDYKGLQESIEKMFTFSSGVQGIPAPLHVDMAKRSLLYALSEYGRILAITSPQNAQQSYHQKVKEIRADLDIPLGNSTDFESLPAAEIQQFLAKQNQQSQSAMMKNLAPQLQPITKMMESLPIEPTKEMQEMLAKLQSSNPEMLQQLQDQSKKGNSGFTQMPDMDTVIGDIMGTSVEIWRQAANRELIFQLHIAHGYLNVKDVTRAKKFLENVTSKKLESGLYQADSKSYGYFLLGLLAEQQNDYETASTNFRKAITYWYLQPQSLVAFVVPLYDNPTFLLEKALLFELQNNNQEKAYDYMEFARSVRFDHPELYGHLSEGELTAYKAFIEKEFTQLITLAKASAKKQKQLKAFEQALKNGQSLAQKSARGAESPVLPSVNIINSIFQWAPRQEAVEWLSHVERYSTTYWYQKINEHRDIVDSESSFVSEEFLLDKLNWADKGLVFQEGFATSGFTPIAKIQEAMDAETTLISIMVMTDGAYQFIINKGGIKHQKLSKNTLIQMADAFQQSPHQETGNPLWTALFDRNKTYLKKNLVFIVNSALQNTPFAALPLQNRYMGDEYLIRYAPFNSEAGLLSTPPSHTTGKMLIAEAANVPGQQKLELVEEEIRSIQKAFSSSLIGSQELNSAAVRKALPKHSIFHFAGHSRLNKDFPDQSAMKLYNDELRFSDITKMNLSKLELAVLSSCSSGESNGLLLNNEFAALNHAFLRAGARSVVASLHPVQDRYATEFMKAFYSELKTGARKDQALQKAQAVVRDQFSSDPKHWAAFVLSGDPSPIHAP